MLLLARKPMFNTYRLRKAETRKLMRGMSMNRNLEIFMKNVVIPLKRKVLRYIDCETRWQGLALVCARALTREYCQKG